MILQILGSDKALRLGDNSLLNLVSSFDWAPAFNAQDIFEMGNTVKLDTALEIETSGSFDMSSVGMTAGMLARMKVVRDGSGNFTGFLYDSGGAGGKNAYSLTQDDLAEMRFDLIMHEKTDQVHFNRSLYLPSLFLTGFSGKLDTQGMGTETFNFAGQFVTGFPAPFHDIRSVYGTYTSATTATLYDTTVSSTTYTLAFLNVDGRPITTKPGDPTFATLGAAGVVTITTTEGYTIPVGAYITACVYKTIPGTTFPTTSPSARFQTSTSQPISYIKGYQGNAYIAPASASGPLASELWLRVQSIDYSVDLKVDTLRQIAQNLQGSSIYARVPTFPISISCNATCVESDWADWKKLLTQNKTFAGTGNVHSNTFDFAPANMASQFAVVIDYFTKGGAKIQNWQFLDMRPEGYGSRQSIGGKGEITWSLRGTSFALTGFNP
jgi:hypothetical protein